jgi:hypothetical protein
MMQPLVRILPFTGPHRSLLRYSGNPSVHEYDYPEGDPVLRDEADLSARRHQTSRMELCTLHDAGLVYTDRFHERGLYGIHSFLTELGEQVLAQLEQGLVWDMASSQVDLTYTRKMWDKFLCEPLFTQEHVQRVSKLKHPDFADVWPRLTYILMGADLNDGVWVIPQA